MAKIFLTALRVSPQKAEDLAVPIAYSVETADIVKQIALTAAGGVQNTHLKVTKSGGRYSKNLKVAEKLGEVYLMADFNNAASSPYNTGVKTSAIVPGNGATKAAGTTKPLTAYHNSITTGDATSTAVALPPASEAGLLNSAKVVKNAASVSILVYPTATNFLDGSSTVAATIAAGAFKHFYAPASNKWVTCKGPYY